MNPTSPNAFLLSATLHGVVVALALLFGYVNSRHDQDAPRILELVAGEGDNYAAREAPALGTEGGVKLTLPVAPAVTPAPPAPVTPAPAPVTPAPAAPKSAPTANPEIPNFKKKIQYEIVRGDAKARLQLRREHAAEEKRKAEERKQKAEAEKRMTLEEFRRAQKSGAKSSGSVSTKVARIDSEGIAKGVVGGSVNNKVGGAGGKALVSDNDDVMAAYYAMFKQRLRVQFEPPPGLSDSLKVTIEVRSNADGKLSNARVTRSSGSRDFDRSVLDAIARVAMPPRPQGKSETIEFVFTMRERDEG